MAVTLEQINITVPAQMAKFVRQKVSSGKFDSPSAVVRDALQRAMDAEAVTDRTADLTPSEFAKAKRGVQRGIQDLDEGRSTEFSESGLRAFFADSKIRNAKRLTASTANRSKR